VGIVTSFFGKRTRDMLTCLGSEEEAALDSMPAIWTGDPDLWDLLPICSSWQMLGDVVLDSALTLYRNELRIREWGRTVPKIAVFGPWITQKLFQQCRTLEVKDWSFRDVIEKGKIFRQFYPWSSKNVRKMGIWNWNRVIVPGFCNEHWFLGIIDFDTREFRYYDSFGVGKRNWILKRMQVQMFYTLPTMHVIYCRTTVHHSNSFCAHIQKLNK
jgi:hypothetical protein